jgi:hypothetical protein
MTFRELAALFQKSHGEPVERWLKLQVLQRGAVLQYLVLCCNMLFGAKRVAVLQCAVAERRVTLQTRRIGQH